MHAELREFATEAETLYGKQRFKVKNRSGAPPTLVFSSKGKGSTPLRTRIDAWKRNAIMDYLATRLAAPAALTAGEL